MSFCVCLLWLHSPCDEVKGVACCDEIIKSRLVYANGVRVRVVTTAMFVDCIPNGIFTCTIFIRRE